MADKTAYEPGANAGSGVTSVAASSPLASSGGATPTISLSGTVPKANGGTGEDNSTGGTANTVWARPDGSTGAASYRALVAADIPNLSAAKITSGTLGGVIAVASASSDPSGSNGQIYYNSADNKFRVYQNGAWTDMVGSGGGSFKFSPTTVYPTGVGDAPGDYTTGSLYVAVAPLTITGVQLRRYETGATLVVKVWSGNVALASKTTSPTGAGLHSVTLDTPVAIAVNTAFYITVYNNATYARSSALFYEVNPPLPLPFGEKALILHPGTYKGGDGQPDTLSSGERYPVEPIYE